MGVEEDKPIFDMKEAEYLLTKEIPLLNENIKINSNLIKENIQEKILLQLKKINKSYSDLKSIIDYENQFNFFLSSKKAIDFDERLISFMIIENEIIYNQTPRLIQIICLLYYLECIKNKCGLILEVLSGEGKTLIISFLALYFAVKGKKVDILTSSPVLAERDAKNRQKFYERFRVSCDFCRKDSKNVNEKRLLECYKADIVYGDGLNLIGDILRYEFMGKKGRGKERPFHFIIIDEIDNICLDNLRNIVELIDNFPGFGFLEFLYLFIYDRLKIEINQLKINQEANFAKKNKNLKLKKEEYQDKLELDFNQNLKKNAESIIHEVAKKTRKFLHDNKKKSNFDKEKILIPENCYGFINARVVHWSKMAYDAEFNFKRDKHYIIYKDKTKGIDKIKPIDYINTGVTLHYSVWSGLHQFLQIKEGLELTGENINSSFMSYLSYFKKYNLIFGITGTLGSEKSQKAINDIYKINLLRIPPFKKRQFDPHKPKVFQNLKEYDKEIMNEIVKFSAIDQRVVLVLFEYIAQAKEMEAQLKEIKESQENSILKNTKIILYIDSDMDNSFLEKEMRPNTIILSTNLSGRGTDIKIDSDAEKNGGLHVIITFMPYNERIEQQAQGRAARRGEKGSSITIIASKNKYDTLIKRRENYEKEQYEFLINLFSPQLDLNQKFFEEFCKKLEDIKNINTKLSNNILSDLKERWSMFILKNNINSFMNDMIHPILAGLFFKLYKKIFTKNYGKLIKEIDLKDYKYNNPFYQMKPNLSIEDYESAIKKSPMFSLGAYYNQAYVYIKTKKKANYHLLVSKNFEILLEICDKFIQQYKKYIELYEQIHKNDYYDKNKTFEEKKPFLRQCEEKIIIMKNLQANVKKNLGKMDEKNNLIIKKEYDINSFKEISKNTLEYFKNFGIEFLFEIECVSK